MDAGQVRSRRQFDGQRMFARLGIAPTPYWTDRAPEGLPRPILIYEWQDGAPPALGMREQRLALAQVAAQVHTADPDELRRFSPRPVNLDYFWRVLAGGFAPTQAWLHELGALATARLYAELADGAARLVEHALPHWSGVLPAPIHGDLLAENVVVAGGVPVLLDWELFGLGDPALEVARFLQDLRAEVAAEEAEDWLESYLFAADQPGLAARIAAYRRLLPFQQLTFLLDGLRQLTPAERADAEFQAHAGAARGDLAAGIGRGMRRPRRLLRTGRTDARRGVRADCGDLWTRKCGADCRRRSYLDTCATLRPFATDWWADIDLRRSAQGDTMTELRARRALFVQNQDHRKSRASSTERLFIDDH